MASHSPSAMRTKDLMSRILAYPTVQTAALVALCAAYIQGPLTKIADFNSASAEMNHFGLNPPAFFAVVVILFELTASAMVISGILRWAGALALAGFTFLATMIALRFWEMAPGVDRMMATNAFFEHLGLIGAFVIVAAIDLTRDQKA